MGPSAARLAPPAGVDAEQIEAKTHDGVVAVTIPLPSEAMQEPGHDHPDRLLTSLNTPGRHNRSTWPALVRLGAVAAH